MSFRFPLQSVLHMRQSLERQQELRLRAANQQVARVRHVIDQIEAKRAELLAARDGELSAGMTGAELRFALQCESELIRRGRELDQQLARIEQLRDQQRTILERTRQARETLEALRDRQQQVYRQEAARREQRRLDDLFLMRRKFVPPGSASSK